MRGIGSYAFSYCMGFKSFRFPEGLEKIGNSICFGCSNLENVYIPSSVKEMKYYAFHGCYGLKKVVSDIPAESLFTFSSDNFESYAYLNASLLVPKGAVPNYQDTAAWKNFVTIKEQFMLGDVNEDVKVDIGDVVATVNYVLGNVPDVFNLDAADVDESGEINISDVVGIVNLVLNPL